MLKTRRTLATVCGLALLAAAPAAQAAGPEPCGGALLITDAVGDQSFKANGQNAVPGPSNTDTAGLFFRVDGGKVTANIVMEDLTLAPPEGFQAIRYRAYYTVDDVIYYVQALSTADGVAYSWGEDFFGAAYTKDGDTTGAVFEGKKGVVQIVLPAENGGKPGTELKATSASIGVLTIGDAPEESQTNPVYFGLDTAPDGAADGPDTTPESCAAPVAPKETPAPAPTEAPVTPEAQPQPAPPAQQQQPVSGSSTPATGPFRLTLASAKLSAKKANRTRSAAFVLKSSQAVSGLTVRLKRGAKVAGSGNLARLGSTGIVKVKLTGKLKKGVHRLVITGKRADGSALVMSVTVTVTA